eukprot:scaffold4081_cov119-Isochrysis_galbana.AAC.1
MQRLRTTRRVGVDDDLAKAYARRPADLTGVQAQSIHTPLTPTHCVRPYCPALSSRGGPLQSMFS